MKFVIGLVLGFLIATAGFSNLATFADRQVDAAKSLVKDNVK